MTARCQSGGKDERMDRGGRRNWQNARVWTWAHLVSLLGILAVLVYVNRGQWFFGDEWDFILHRGFHHARSGFFRPHNEHWSTIPIIWYRATFSVFGLRSYWPYMFGLFATHLVVVHSAWRIMRRVGVNALLATGLALILGLYGPGSENLIWAFQVGFVGSLAAGLLLVLAVDERGSPTRVALIALGTIAMLMFSGISVVMVGAVGLTAFARWGWRRAAAVVAPAALAYLVWLKVYGTVGLHGGNEQFHGGPSDIPRYVWGGISTTFGAPLHSRRAGEILLVVLIATVAVKGRQWWRTAPEVLGAAAAAPVMFAVISQGRGAIQDPSAGRYLYLALGMLLPLIGYALQSLVGNRRPATTLAVAGCLAVAASSVGILRENAAVERTRELTIKGQMLESISLASAETVVSDTPDYRWASDVTVAHLRTLAARKQLPAFGAPTIRDIANARLALQVNVVPDAPNPPEALDASRGALGIAPIAAVAPDTSPTCRRVNLQGGANLIVRNAQPANTVASFTIRPSNSDDAFLFVPYTGGNAGPRMFPMTAGKTALVQDAIPGDLVFQLPAGENVICGLQWASG